MATPPRTPAALSESIRLRLTPETHHALIDLAMRNRRTASAEAEIILAEAFKQERKK